MRLIRSKKVAIAGIGLFALTVFLAWRFVRPMNIFVVSEAFERPIPTHNVPVTLQSLSASECAACHREFYEEWSTTIHSKAWIEPYFQTDWTFDGRQQICKNCHTPLDRQQEHKVLGFRDQEKWGPILEPNPEFDPKLQHEGVTCAACHFRDGRILGPYESETAPHPVKKLADPNQICVRCHIVGGERWDTFLKFPPCGTVAEIRSTPNAMGETKTPGAPLGSNPQPSGVLFPPKDLPTSERSAYSASAGESAAQSGMPNCVGCHMPLAERPLVPGGQRRQVRRHLWRGEHDPAMVRQGLDVNFRESPASSHDRRTFTLTVTNVGAAHYLPTGTPDRHLTVSLRLLDRDGRVIDEETQQLKRTVLWRPFIVDLRDTRLPRWQTRVFEYSVNTKRNPTAVAVEASVRYHLLDEARRERIDYKNTEPIAYDVFHERITLSSDRPK